MGLRSVYFYCDWRETPVCLALHIKPTLASHQCDRVFRRRKASFTYYYWLSAEKRRFIWMSGRGSRWNSRLIESHSLTSRDEDETLCSSRNIIKWSVGQVSYTLAAASCWWTAKVLICRPRTQLCFINGALNFPCSVTAAFLTGRRKVAQWQISLSISQTPDATSVECKHTWSSTSAQGYLSEAAISVTFRSVSFKLAKFPKVHVFCRRNRADTGRTCKVLSIEPLHCCVATFAIACIEMALRSYGDVWKTQVRRRTKINVSVCCQETCREPWLFLLAVNRKRK